MRILLLFAFATMLLISCNHKKTVFQKIAPSSSNIDFTNKLEDRDRFNILYYLYYYNGGGVAIGDINNDGLPDIYFTANSKGNNKLYLNKGNFTFEDITEKAGVAGTADWCSGVTMADVNGDGLLDIYVCAVSNYLGLQGSNELFINNGDGTFTEKAHEYGLDFSGLSTQAAFFDYDHDGDLDCYLLNHSFRPHSNVVDTSNRQKHDAISGDVFFRNDLKQSGRFADVTATAGIYQSILGYGLGIAVADFNNDGWDDVYIGNDFHENDYYYLNNGNGTFTESGSKHFRHYSRFSMGNDAADYNNDGQIDLITVDMLPDDEKVLKTYGSDENADIYKMKLHANGYQDQYSRNCLQRNNGDGSSFSDVSLLTGVSATDWSWSPLFADFDNDGIKDLFVSSGIVKRPVDLDYIRFVSDLSATKGMDYTNKYDKEAIDKMPDGSSHPFFFKGDGHSFNNVSDSWGTADMKGYFNGAAYADLNNDGNVDVVINQINGTALLLKNNAPKKNYITIAFRGDTLNSFGVGCKAYLFTTGQMQFQQLMPTRGFQSSSDQRLHFGIGDHQQIDSILVVWPDQKFQIVRNIKPNQQLLLRKSDASAVFHYQSFFPQQHDMLQPAELNISWSHKEDDFVDYNTQYLIPHAQSTRGPKIAVADVNGDGLDDMYLCGAHGQPGSLLLQQRNGSFVSVDENVFSADALSEDVDALFFDANGDGKPDLFVVSGGNKLTGNNPALLDRLYLNVGNGHFTRSDALPQIFANKSCVAAADVDADGDVDLFVGTLADARAYGLPQTSYLLINDGKGKFSIATDQKINLKNVGMVTSAAFADINKDGKPDLVIAGEWMSVTTFINQGSSFASHPLAASTGWWQTVMLTDVDGDGNIDILAGNWGWNNKFWSGKNGPVRLYVKDFDNNGQVDQLLSYTYRSKEYPFLAKDEVEKALPVLRKHYLHYSDFAGLEMKDAYYGFAEQVQPLMAERLGSVVCFGDGKGGFNIKDLPADLQIAPIFSFQLLQQQPATILAGGNFFDAIPYEGKYDGQPLALFSVQKDRQLSAVRSINAAAPAVQVRDAKWINTAAGKKLIVACNNDKLLAYSIR